jgi:hypothetical protein
MGIKNQTAIGIAARNLTDNIESAGKDLMPLAPDFVPFEKVADVLSDLTLSGSTRRKGRINAID